MLQHADLLCNDVQLLADPYADLHECLAVMRAYTLGR